MEKLVQDLVLKETQETESVPLGSNNSAMFEVWIKSEGGTTPSFEVLLQGSNDRHNWSHLATETINATGLDVPHYVANQYSSVVTFSHVRLKFQHDVGSALLDADIRPHKI